MSKKAGLIIACLLAAAAPAAAQTVTCTEPPPPAPVDGNTATQAQLQAAAAGVRAYMAQSDSYQQCLLDSLNSQKADAIKNNTAFDPQIQQDIMARAQESQDAKQKAADSYNAAAAAYKKRTAAN